MHGIGGQAHGAVAVAAHGLDEVLDQERQILETLAQRRHLDRKHVEAVEQVLAERALEDRVLEVAMRGRDDAHVAAHAAVAADALVGALLQHAQDLDLHRQRHVADLVEEQRAAVGHFETALARGDRAGEGSLLVTEQLGLEQLARDRAAVDGDERPVAARRLVMHGARDDFLAGAGLAGDEHRGLVRGHLLDHAAHAPDGGRVAGRTGVASRGGFLVHAHEAGAAQQIVELRVAHRLFEREAGAAVETVLLADRLVT